MSIMLWLKMISFELSLDVNNVYLSIEKILNDQNQDSGIMINIYLV